MSANTRNLMKDIQKIQRAVIEADHRAKQTGYLIEGTKTTAPEDLDLTPLERTEAAIGEARIYLDSALIALRNEVSNIIDDEAHS